MTDRNLVEANWEDCPKGKISGFAARLNAKPRRAPVRLSYVATLAVLSGILAVRLSEASQMELERISKIGGVSCAEVLSHVDSYIRGELKGEFRTQMGFHLSNCPHCARKVRGVAKSDMFGGLFGALGVASNSSASAALPQKRKWCDDAPVVAPSIHRIPVVAQKVLAAAEE